MLTTYLKRQNICTRYYASPVGPYLDEFTDWLASRGFRGVVIRNYLPGVYQFGAWVKRTHGSLTSLPPEAPERFRHSLAKRGRLRIAKGEHSVLWRGAKHFVDYLRLRHPLVDPAVLPITALPALIDQFEHWMQTHRGVRSSTLGTYQRHIVSLLSKVGERPELFEPRALQAFILSDTHHYAHAFTKTRVTAIRMFLRFLIATARCQPGLESAIPTVAEWPLARLPRYMSPEDVERVIAACEQTSPLGLRNRAILLLLARLGLRAGEVAGLTLADIDWAAATFTVIGKTRREARLPLPQDAGEALLEYIERARPSVETNRVFITVIAPWAPITRFVVKQVAARAIRRAGVDAPSYGAHVFRHSAATAMLRQGASLQVVGEVLRHRSLETTAHYAKVDTSLLHEIARPWPGVVS
jgi:site-specific recombinase XerD